MSNLKHPMPNPEPTEFNGKILFAVSEPTENSSLKLLSQI